MIKKKLKNKKVLVVEEIEDDTSLRRALRDKFNLEGGFKVLEARDGQEGLATALREHPDIILLDIAMPKMDGMAMLKKLREDTWGKSVRVIMLTNLDDMEKVAEVMGNQVFEYIVKSNSKIENIVAEVKVRLGV